MTSTTQALTERIIAERTKHMEKIRKMLALANDDAHGGEHERNVAMEMARKLMIKHNIDMGQIYAEFTREGDSIQVQSDPWLRRAAHAASILFMTYMYYSKIKGTQKYKVTFVGQRANVETTIEMANYLIKSVRREGTKFRREHGDIARLETNFLNAAANTLAVRAHKLSVEQEQDPEVVAMWNRELAENKARAAEMVGKIKDGNMKTDLKMDTPEEYEAAMKGKLYGEEVSLHKQVA
ncbi:conserved hypothetical protein [Delftia phage PhiW-14]|uniref:Uncharacterized protein n=1 Tax=Delftia phage PhiW-14 TaxID=665032 RepID=C9DGH3_BPW14|nr:hypothetical protein DP-phiW-14_gp203 [Delftia phage PhiW-14]ACV50224.1 conserved hypothetical protein [Delftia phage PhiW-14]